METLSAAPLVRVGYGWSGGDIYDMTIEVRPDCASRPMRLLFPTAQLAQDQAARSPLPASAGVTTASVWVTYDNLHSRRYPVRLAAQDADATTGPAAPSAQRNGARPGQWSDYVDLAPGRTARFRLRFSLPPMELGRRLLPKTVPETFTLTLDHLDLGCTAPLTIRRTFPLQGRELLLKLGPRAK